MIFLLSCAADDPSVAPRVAFEAPGWGQVLSGTAEIIVTRDPPGEVEVADEGAVTWGSDETPLTIEWDTTSSLDGDHLLTAAEAAVQVWVQNDARDQDDLRFVQPDEGQTVCGALAVEVLPAADAVEVELFVDTVSVGTAGSPPWRVSWSPERGEHRVRAVATFADGAQLARAVNVVGDPDCDEAPTLTITSPTAETWLSAATTLTADVAAGTDTVSWYVDDGFYLLSDEPPFTVEWDVTPFADGVHSVRAVAERDGAEGRAELRVGLDRAAPSLEVLSPAEGENLSGTVTLSALATDAQGEPGLTVEADGETACTLVDGACTWDTTAVAFGEHTILWTAADMAGNTTEASLTVRVDNPPSVTWVEPTDGAEVSGVVIPFFEVEDDEGVAEVSATLDGGDLVSSWDTCAAEAGAHSLSVTATDLAGQVTVATITVTVGRPLEVVLGTGTTLTLGDTLEAWTTSAEDVARVEWDLDGVPVGDSLLGDVDPTCSLGCGDCVAWTATAAPDGVTEGAHLLTATATDVTGETASASAWVELRLDADGDGYATAEAGGDDCDDAEAAVHPGVAETCDGRDEDCDGAVDEDFDADGDGHLDAEACDEGDDCDDTDPTVSPDAASDACDGRDDDCDGWVDNAAPVAVGEGTFGDGADHVTVSDDLFGDVVTPDEDVVLTDVAIYLDPASTATTTLVVYADEGLSVWSRVTTASLVGDGSLGWYRAEDLSIPLSGGRAWLLAVEVDGSADIYFVEGAALTEDAGLTPSGSIQGSNSGLGLGEDPVISDVDTTRLVWQAITVAVPDPDDADADADGVTAGCGDCDDADADVSPSATEVCGDDVDDDCDGTADPCDSGGP